jgi:hypothetical protein
MGKNSYRVRLITTRMVVQVIPNDSYKAVSLFFYMLNVSVAKTLNVLCAV